MSSQQIVTIAFLGNIDYDTRCLNLFNSLKQKGYDVNFIGFDWLTENFSAQKGKKNIYKLHKGFLSLTYYFNFIYLKPYNSTKPSSPICNFYKVVIYSRRGLRGL